MTFAPKAASDFGLDLHEGGTNNKSYYHIIPE